MSNTIKSGDEVNLQLSLLVDHFSYECICGDIQTEISGIAYNSGKVSPGCIFVCMTGLNSDGHSYAGEALEKGARVLVISKPVPLEERWRQDVTVLLVGDTRYALACLSAAFFQYPAKKLNTIGITGTKGKTTVSCLVKSMLEHSGRKTGLIGTIETVIGEEHIPAENTTPESYILQETLDKMVKAGCDTVVMEVSSQALKMHRTAGISFDYGVYTNLSQDHIGPGEHESFEEYLWCKSLLFKQCRVGIVNADDAFVNEIIKNRGCRLETYGITKRADIRAENLRLVKNPGELGVEFDITGSLNVKAKVPVPGVFSVYNALAAAAVCRHLLVSPEEMRESLLAARVRGRMEPVEVSEEFTLLIDYAHNAVSLKSLLHALREYEPERIVCVFGCGGNRSRLRRFEMGEVSGSLAEFTIITSDNPRFEDPQSIMDDIETGIRKTDGAYVKIGDRKEAIAYAIAGGRPGDLIVIAGKGHEAYQEIKGVKYPMDDRILIEEIIKELSCNSGL